MKKGTVQMFIGAFAILFLWGVVGVIQTVYRIVVEGFVLDDIVIFAGLALVFAITCGMMRKLFISIYRQNPIN